MTQCNDYSPASPDSETRMDTSDDSIGRRSFDSDVRPIKKRGVLQPVSDENVSRAQATFAVPNTLSSEEEENVIVIDADDDDKRSPRRAPPPAPIKQQRIYPSIPKPLVHATSYFLNPSKFLLIGLDSSDAYRMKIHLMKIGTSRNAVVITRDDWAFVKSKIPEIDAYFKEDNGTLMPSASPAGTLQILMTNRLSFQKCLMFAQNAFSQIIIQAPTWKNLSLLVPVLDAHFDHSDSIVKYFFVNSDRADDDNDEPVQGASVAAAVFNGYSKILIETKFYLQNVR